LAEVLEYAIVERLIENNSARKIELPSKLLRRPCERFYSLEEARRPPAKAHGREHLVLSSGGVLRPAANSLIFAAHAARQWLACIKFPANRFGRQRRSVPGDGHRTLSRPAQTVDPSFHFTFGVSDDNFNM